MNLPDDYVRAWDTPGKVRRRGLRKNKKRGKRTSKQAGVVRKPGQRRTQAGDHKHCTCACPTWRPRGCEQGSPCMQGPADHEHRTCPTRRPQGCKQTSPCTALQTTGARVAWLPGEEETDPGSASVRAELTKHFHKRCHKITAQPQLQVHWAGCADPRLVWTHRLCCSIRACFSRSSRSAAARLSSSLFARIAIWYGDKRSGKMSVEEAMFLLKLECF